MNDKLKLNKLKFNLGTVYFDDLPSSGDQLMYFKPSYAQVRSKKLNTPRIQVQA